MTPHLRSISEVKLLLDNSPQFSDESRKQLAHKIVDAVIKICGIPLMGSEGPTQEQIASEHKRGNHAMVADYCTNLADAVMEVWSASPEQKPGAQPAIVLTLRVDAERHRRLAGLQGKKGSAFERVGEGRP